MPHSKAINWLETARIHLVADFPDFKSRSAEIANALSRLLMERLPIHVGSALAMLLPEDARRKLTGLRVRAGGHGNPEIGYPDFVQKAFEILNRSDFPTRTRELQRLASRIADSYLWSVAQEFPPDLKSRIADLLPIELRSRMNLFSGHGEEEQVA